MTRRPAPSSLAGALVVLALLLGLVPLARAEAAPEPSDPSGAATSAGSPSFAPDPYFYTPPAGAELIPSRQVFFVKTGQVNPRTGTLSNCGWVHHLIVQDRGPGTYVRVSRQNGTTNPPFPLGPRQASLTEASGYPLEAPPGATLTQITGTGFGCSPVDFGLIAREQARLAGLEYNVYFQAATRPPNAAFEATAATDGSRQVTFANRATDADDTPEQLTYRWLFGDGTSSAEVDPVHTYDEPGEYTVTLTVTDSRGLKDSDTQVIEVPAGPLDGALFPFPTGDATIKEGEKVGVRLRVENLGDVELSSVAVTGVTLTAVDEAGTGRATITPKAGGETLSGTLGTGGGGANLDFADYEVEAEAAGIVRIEMTVRAVDPEGTPFSAVIPWELTIRPGPIRVAMEVSYAEPPGGTDEPPGFQRDNDGDGDIDEQDHRVEIAVTATNVSDGDVAAVEVNDVAEPIDFDDRYLGGGEVYLDPLDTPADTEFGDLGPGEAQTLTFAYEAKEPVWADATTIVRGRQGDAAGPLVTGVGRTEVRLDAVPTIEVEVRAERIDDELLVTSEVENVSDREITDLDSDGLVIEGVEDLDDPTTLLPLPIDGGRREGALPSSLAVGATAEVVTRFDIVGDGAAVLTERITGELDGEPVLDRDVVSVEVENGEVSLDQAEAVVRDGLRDTLRTLDETNALIADDLIGDLVGAGGTPTEPMSPELRANIDSWKAAGFSEEWATSLAVWEAERETFDERMAATWQGFKAQAAARGTSAQASAAAFLGTITDYEKVEMIVTDIWDGGIENLGYLGDVSAMTGPELLEVAIPANQALVADTAEDLQLAWQGQKQLWQLERGAFLADPSAASRTVGRRQGGYLADGTIDAGIAIFGEGALQATSKLAAPLLRSQGIGLDVGMSTTRIDPGEGLDGTADALGDPAARLARLEQANRDSLQNLPTGTVIELDDLFGTRTGMAPDDAAFFQEVAASMERDFPEIGEFVIQFRTAEPSTINLPGALGKEEWNAYKAVGALDEAIGGPRALRGQVSVFPPVPLSQDALDALEATTPGFTKSYAERFATQQKNWDEFNSGKGSVNTILAGSQRHGPIRIINGRPGNPTEGLTYLEQLDEPEFVAGLGLSDAEVAALRSRMERHPGLTEPVELLAQPMGDAVGFARKMPDGTIRPYGSDYDLQYFGPADGVWPAGKRGQIITEFMRRASKNPRVPAHGASDLGFDLDSQYFKKLAEYIMLPIHPASAGPKARELVGRAKQIARDLRLQADAIAAKNPTRAAAMRANADKLDAITVEELEGFAKGEKTILITPGDIRVGRGE